jgi:hypothetical protein
MEIERIGTAVEECLGRCRGSFYPLGELADYLERLRQDPAWSEYDVEAVELRVHRMLKSIVSVSPSRRESLPDQASVCPRH